MEEPVMRLLQQTGARNLTADSRTAGPGAVFAAYPGTARDGRDFIPQAISRGAAGVLWEARDYVWDPAWRVANAAVERLREKIGDIAAQVYGEPSRALRLTGVTGTNGKTSVAHWIAQAQARLGEKTAVMGTVGNGFPGQLVPAGNTTPDAIELQKALSGYVREGARACALEVSSHGLDQGRVNGCHFHTAVFTNLSRDHLDYHGDMASYAAAKARLFSWPELQYAVLNLDDPQGAALARELKGPRVIGYSLAAAGALRGRISRNDLGGLALAITSDWGGAELHAAVLGAFNASNLLAALGALLAAGEELPAACQALAGVQPPPGRMQLLGAWGQPTVVVDYAHTPDALEQVLKTLRQAAGTGRVICVFGCGGNRDRGKRSLMGRVAEACADLVIVTSDNPRREDPLAILSDIVAGMARPPRVEADRARAIFEAVGEARSGDVVLIAGKGHESYQEIEDRRLPFDDAEVARRALAAWGGRRA